MTDELLSEAATAEPTKLLQPGDLNSRGEIVINNLGESARERGERLEAERLEILRTGIVAKFPTFEQEQERHRIAMAGNPDPGSLVYESPDYDYPSYHQAATENRDAGIEPFIYPFDRRQDIDSIYEPLSDFLSRYIPEWRELDPRQLADELKYLHTQFEFLEAGYANSTREQVAIADLELSDDAIMYLDTVSYYPNRTAAWEEGSNLKLNRLYQVVKAPTWEYLTEGEVYKLDGLGKNSVSLHKPIGGGGTIVRRSLIGNQILLEEVSPFSEEYDEVRSIRQQIEDAKSGKFWRDLSEEEKILIRDMAPYSTDQELQEGYIQYLNDALDDALLGRTTEFADVQTIQQANVNFILMQKSTDAIEALLETVKAWESQVESISHTVTDTKVIKRAEFAAQTAFIAAKTLQANKCCVIAAYRLQGDEAEIVGLGIFQVYPDKTTLISLVTTAPKYQPNTPGPKIRGIGTGLTCAMAGELISVGVHQVCLQPLDDDARTFWQNRGFTQSGSNLCVIDDLSGLLRACEPHDCPDNGDHCGVGNADQIAAYRTRRRPSYDVIPPSTDEIARQEISSAWYPRGLIENLVGPISEADLDKVIASLITQAEKVPNGSITTSIHKVFADVDFYNNLDDDMKVHLESSAFALMALGYLWGQRNRG